jgi:hypothetical protein
LGVAEAVTVEGRVVAVTDVGFRYSERSSARSGGQLR